MHYILIFLSLFVGLLGAFEKVIPAAWRRGSVWAVAGTLLLTALAQFCLTRREEWLARYAKDTGTLGSPYRSSAPQPRLQLCESSLIVKDPSKPIIKWTDDDIYLRMDDGEAKVSLTVRDSNGIVMAMVRDNVWFVPRSAGRLDRNFNDNTLEVIGPRNEISLQVQVLGEKVRLAGTTHPRAGGKGAVIGPFLNECDGVGETVFRYPSEKFPGETNRPAPQSGH